MPDGVAWGYASSIHKAQGGEFNHVIAIVARRMARTFGKPALYTGFSRARQTLAVVGEIDAIPHIISSPGQKRTTVLGAMLAKPLPKAAIVDIAARLKEMASGQNQTLHALGHLRKTTELIETAPDSSD